METELALQPPKRRILSIINEFNFRENQDSSDPAKTDICYYKIFRPLSQDLFSEIFNKNCGVYGTDYKAVFTIALNSRMSSSEVILKLMLELSAIFKAVPVYFINSVPSSVKYNSSFAAAFA